MQRFTDALGIQRPVYWTLPEKKDANLPGRSVIEWDKAMPDIEQAKETGCGVFICPNELGDQRNDKGHLRHRENVIRFTCVFTDIDKGEPEHQLERLEHAALPPSMIIRTGRGYHGYWILERFDPVEPAAWERVQKELARHMGGDTACTDPARLMRLPGSWHVKGEPKPVQIIHLNTAWVYILSEFPGYEAPVKRFVLPPKKHGRSLIPSPYAPRIRKITEGDRHITLVKETARYFSGVAPSEIDERKGILKAWYIQSCRPLKPDWEKEVDDMVAWIIKKELGNY